VAATVGLLHRRHGWGIAAFSTGGAALLAFGASSSAQSQGTPPPAWFQDIAIGLAALTILIIVVTVVETVLLRRRPAAVRAQAVPLAAHHARGARAHHYPPRHRVIWAVRWIGMLLILVMAVISAPGVVDGAAYLAGAGSTVTFSPVSHQTTCDPYSCETGTDGILATGGAGVEATWPDVVPLGRSFQVRAPVWRWGLGEALIDSDGIAVAAVLISLLIEGFAVLVLVSLVRLARNWLRHRRGQPASAPVPVR
jgi:hypothetical protein